MVKARATRGPRMSAVSEEGGVWVLWVGVVTCSLPGACLIRLGPSPGSSQPQVPAGSLITPASWFPLLLCLLLLGAAKVPSLKGLGYTRALNNPVLC